ncbi:MAG TPA: hypothetical protein VK932_28740 [Kofleriaceae bacterium]|nr:hypothetical protein [Kofleriaceae bacterium]
MMKLSLPAGVVLPAVFSFLFEKTASEIERLFAGVSRATAQPSASVGPAPSPVPARPRPARGVSRGRRLLEPMLTAAVIGSLVGLGVA